MSGTERYIQQLAVFDLLREDVIRDVIRSLQLPPGSHGLDAGCGIGLQTLPLADAVGPAGHVTGLDLRPEFLTYAERVADRAGLSERVSFEQGDVRDLPFEDDTFDWAWSADCVGYAPLEPLPLLRELTRVVRPGGIVAIAAYSSETLLPGYPLLEANLRATSRCDCTVRGGQKSAAPLPAGTRLVPRDRTGRHHGSYLRGHWPRAADGRAARCTRGPVRDALAGGGIGAEP